MSHRTTSARRRAAALATTIAAVAAFAGLGAPPASADAGPAKVLAFVPTSGSTLDLVSETTVAGISGIGPHQQAFAGHFSGDTGGDLFLYNPGSGPDSIVHLNKSGAYSSTKSVPVGGTFTPIVGDFDGNGFDDIVWYAPGSAADHLWLFKANGTHADLALSISGTYRPTVLDANADGRADILWYSPTSTDSLWLFGAGATSHTVKSISAGPGYTLVAGNFGVTPGSGAVADRVVFFNPSGADYFWTFDDAGNHTSATLPALDGNYRLLSGQFIEETYGSIFFYGPGSLPEVVWAFGPGAGGDVSVETPGQVNGTYTVQTGDFDHNGLSDIAFSAGSTTTIWKLKFDGSHSQLVVNGLPNPGLTRPVAILG